MSRTDPHPRHLVILDAGHGITTAGKRSPFTFPQLRHLMAQYPYMFPWMTPQNPTDPPDSSISPKGLAPSSSPKGGEEASPHPLLKEGKTQLSEISIGQKVLPLREDLGGSIPLREDLGGALFSPPLGESEGAGGAVGSCLLEWQLNRDIARRTQQLLLEMDYDARLLVPEEVDLPLRARIARATEMCREHQGRGGIWPNRLMVSIHCNASPTSSLAPSSSPKGGETKPIEVSLGQEVLPFGEDLGGALSSPPLGELEGAGGSLEASLFTSPSGWECHVCGHSYNARQLAGQLYRQAALLLPSCFPLRGKRGVLPRHECIDGMTDYALQPKVSDFYILRHAPCIAVLTENLFMDSPKDCAWLLTEDGRNTLAHIHATAIHYHLL